MSPLWTADAIAAATGGRASGHFTVDHVAFDSREVVGGELFVAMRGAAMDGHAFVDQAAARGAAGFVAERPIAHPHVLVPDSFAALRALGAAARARAARATVVGVTGSVGKTGVKEALRLAFARTHPDATHASVKSYNNHTGVPLSLARMPAATRWGVFEMGMNHAGEIGALTRQVRPHVAVVTWVANAHIENFADGEPGIARAKAEIFEGLEPGGAAIIPADNPHAPILLDAARAHAGRVVRFGAAADADARLLSADVRPDGSDIVADIMGERLHCRVGMAGRHWVSNALAVLAAVKAAGGDLGEAGLALAGMTDLPGRGARVRVRCAGGEAVILDESYNANPASMAAALRVLGDTPAPRRLAVLGAMRELGAGGDALHAALADPIRAANVAELALVGAEMGALRLPNAVHLADWAAAHAWLRDTVRAGDVVLVKGSNSVGLGKLVAAAQGEGLGDAD